MSFPELLKRITILFSVSLLLLTLHILDDAFVVNEAEWYGITTAEFLLGCALIYGVLPPLGLYLARRSRVLGLALLLLYALQAFYGAGLNHVRHLLGDFRGSQLLNTLLDAIGVNVVDTNGQGFWSLLSGMLGLNNGVPPHTHNMFSNIVVFLSIGVNMVLMGFILIALAQTVTCRARRSFNGTHA